MNGILGLTQQSPKPIEVTKCFIVDICNILLEQTFSPQAIKERTDIYVNKENGLPRLLYSEISSRFFAYYIKNHDIQIAIENTECLLDYTSEIEVGEVRDTLLRLCDHCLLVANQIQAIEEIHEQSLAATKEEIKINIIDDVKSGIQREYIAILGIFAAIVLAFVGSFAFSTSVLQNMHTVSACRLTAVCIFIFILFISMLMILLNFIKSINKK